jgi:hypothetical protein
MFLDELENSDDIYELFRKAKERRTEEQEEKRRARLRRNWRRIWLVVLSALSLALLTGLKFLPEAFASHF